MAIEIVAYRFVPLHKQKGSVIGHVDIYLPHIKAYLRNIKHMVRGDRKWFSFPCFMDTNEEDPKLQWKTTFEFESKELNEGLLKSLPDLVNAFLEKKIQESKDKEQESEKWIEEDLPF